MLVVGFIFSRRRLKRKQFCLKHFFSLHFKFFDNFFEQDFGNRERTQTVALGLNAFDRNEFTEVDDLVFFIAGVLEAFVELHAHVRMVQCCGDQQFAIGVFSDE